MQESGFPWGYLSLRQRAQATFPKYQRLRSSRVFGFCWNSAQVLLKEEDLRTMYIYVYMYMHVSENLKTYMQIIAVEIQAIKSICLVFALFVSFLLLTSSTLWWFLWNNSHTLGYRQKSHTCSCTQRGRKQRSRALKPHEQLQWKKPWYLCFLMAWVVFDLGIFWMQKQCYWAEEINCTMHFKRLCRRSAGRTKSAAELDLQHSFFLLFPGPSLWQFSLQH